MQLRVQSLAIASGAGSLLLAAAATAQSYHPDFNRIDIVNFTSYFMNHPDAAVADAYADAGLNTYRVYAVFYGPAQVIAHGGKSGVGAPAFATSSDGAFYNVVDTGYHGDTHYNFAPTSSQIADNPNHAFDTFGTVGNAIDSGAVGFSGKDGLGGAINNMQTSWEAADEGWFLMPGSWNEGIARQDQEGLENDGRYRVLLYQHTVAAGTIVSGNVGFLGGFTSDGDIWEMWDPGWGELTYSLLPVPGGLALLGLAGLNGSRRRRA